MAALLLTGIVVITVTTGGAAVMSHVFDNTAVGQPVGQVNIDANAHAGTVNVTHLGGDAFAVSQLQVVLASNNDSETLPFAAGSPIDSNNTHHFVPGSTWHFDYSGTLNGSLQKVYVVYTPKNTVLDIEKFTNSPGKQSTGGGNGGNATGGNATGGNATGGNTTGGNTTGGNTSADSVGLGVFTNVTIADRSNDHNGNHASYGVTYGLENGTREVANVTVTVLDHAEGSGHATWSTTESGTPPAVVRAYKGGEVTRTDGANGTTTVVYRHGGDRVGDRFTINVTAYAANGSVLGTYAVNDTADGYDPDGNGVSHPPGGLLTNVTLADGTGINGHTVYTLDYATRGASNVTVTFADLTSGSKSGSTDYRTTPNGSVSFHDDNTGGDRYLVAVTARGADGSTDSYFLSDVANGRDTHRSVNGSALTDVSIADNSLHNEAKYDVSYATNGTAVDHVVAAFVAREKPSASRTHANTNSSGTISYSRGGTGGDHYSIVVAAVGPHGHVLDATVRSDVADGHASGSDGAGSVSSAASSNGN